jgi:hypothetical protein
MGNFISLFSRMSFIFFAKKRDVIHLKCFEIINGTTPKMNDFILEFHNTKFYVVPLVLLTTMLILWSFVF